MNATEVLCTDERPADIFGTLQTVARIFYVVNPMDYAVRNIEDVPSIYQEAWPYFLVFILLENGLRFAQGKSLIRLNDGVVSLSHGILFECSKVISRGLESWLYIAIYNNYRLIDLPWNSITLWYVTALAVDFCYYWVHRANHEVHFLWAQHQVHHTSEDFNLAVGLRQSVVHAWCGMLFYLPLALLGVHPAYLLVHQQFNLLYQFWIHTEVINSLGPLEYILNTPKHHRIHHGSTLECLDKNYGGVLIIWDRLFGTFYERKDSDGIIYGLVYQPPYFNPVYQQVFYNWNVYQKFKCFNKLSDKISAIVKGPSWSPGSRWTGEDENKPDIKSRQKYNPELPTMLKFYLIIHFAIIFMLFQNLISYSKVYSPLSTLTYVAFIVLSLGSMGIIIDAKNSYQTAEVLRCSAFILSTMWYSNVANLGYIIHVIPYIRFIYFVSIVYWFLYACF